MVNQATNDTGENMKKLIAIAAAAMLALAGCGTSDAPPPDAPPATTTAAPTTEPAPEPTGPTVSQWASKIAPIKANWEEQDELWKEKTCSTGLVANPDDAGIYCRAHLIVMGMVASTIESQTLGMVKEGVPAYFGDPPAEVAALHADAIAAAESAALAGDAVECPEKGCQGTSFQFLRAWDKLGDALKSWEPYL